MAFWKNRWDTYALPAHSHGALRPLKDSFPLGCWWYGNQCLVFSPYVRRFPHNTWVSLLELGTFRGWFSGKPNGNHPLRGSHKAALLSFSYGNRVAKMKCPQIFGNRVGLTRSIMERQLLVSTPGHEVQYNNLPGSGKKKV